MFCMLVADGRIEQISARRWARIYQCITSRLGQSRGEETPTCSCSVIMMLVATTLLCRPGTEAACVISSQSGCHAARIWSCIAPPGWLFPELCYLLLAQRGIVLKMQTDFLLLMHLRALYKIYKAISIMLLSNVHFSLSITLI